MASWYVRVRAFWGHSLQRQLAWSFGLVSLISMLAFSYLIFSHEQDFLYSVDNKRTRDIAQALASSSASAVLANDLAGLQEVLHGVAGTSDLKFALILSRRGEVLASTNPEHVGRFMTDDVSRQLLHSAASPRILVNQRFLVDAASPIMAGDRLVGWVRVEMVRNSVNVNLQALAGVASGFTLLAMAASFFISSLLAHRMTRSLHYLMDVAAEIEHGKRHMRADNGHTDELGQLAKSLNRMLDALDESEGKLASLNRLYAAWTDSAYIMVRQSDEKTLLNGICHVLARRVPFSLVWIGMPDEDGWIRPVATSHPDSPFMKSIRISVDASLEEGRGPMGSAIREGVPKIFNDFLQNNETAHWHDQATVESFSSVSAFPLWRGENCYGAIAVYSSEPGFFTGEVIKLMSGVADDISFALDNHEHERQRRVTAVQLELAASVFEHSAENIMVTDASCNIISVNPSFTAVTGYEKEEVLGRNPRILASGRHDREFFRKMWESIHSTGGWRGEIWNRHRSGRIFPESLTITTVKDESGEVTNYIAIFNDITERKRAEERIQQLAHYDILTGLPNRLLFGDRLEHAMIQARRNRSSLAVLFLDLDRFKHINDTLGHDVGDELLKAVAQRLSSCVREQDTVSRQGGDEFIAVLPGTNEAGARHVAEKMLQAITQPYRIHNHDLRVSTSIGVALYPEHAQDTESLVKFADVAMYQAKEGGRNHYLLFDPHMNASSYERLALETGLRAALEKQQLALYFQPQIDLSNERIVGCEALVRWHHPEKGIILPGNFIPLAEETGLIGPISDWVMEEAVRQCRAWRSAGVRHPVVAINLSALQFRQRNLFEQVGNLLDRYGLPPQSLELELTETILMQEVDRTLSALHALTELGVGIAIDDFGTGYSSLSYLKRFPIHKLKIDQSFVRDVNSDENDAAMVRTIILMARSMKLQVVAEGVETKAQADFLLEAGCERAQGFLFAQPMPADDFAKWLRRHATD